MDFGSKVLTLPLLVEAVEDCFVPVCVYNNVEGADAHVLERFEEPAWNNPVVRYLGPDGKDWIPRKDRQWTAHSQLTGYIWAARKYLPQHNVYGALINVLEVPKLPSSENKCRTHGVPYSQCGRYHAKSELLGPFMRTPYQIERWHLTAIMLAKRLKALTKVPLSHIHTLPMEGYFTGGCGAYGGCEFLNFCQAGRPVPLIGQLLVARTQRGGD